MRKITSGSNAGTFCENTACIQLQDAARRGGNFSYECRHVASASYAVAGSPGSLTVDTLDTMQKSKLISEERRKQVDKLIEKACSATVPLLVDVPLPGSSSQRYCHMSIFAGTVRHWSRMGRTIVTYDRKEKKLTCRCSSSRQHCVHKTVGKCYLFQEKPDIIAQYLNADTGSDDGFSGDHHSSDDEETKAPSSMGISLEYIMTQKMYPEVLDKSDIEYPARDASGIIALYPAEKYCHSCKSLLGEAFCINKLGRLVRMSGTERG